MNTQQQQAQPAMKTECNAPTLPAVIHRLTAEKALIDAELKTMTPDAWLVARGRKLINREQELHTTLSVLKHMVALPSVQIQEPTH